MQFLIILLGVAGLAALIAGAELLVRGASRLAIRWGISPLVVGLTVVALGTSSPELAVSIQSSLSGQTDLAVGNVVGSNISNVLLILGLSAVFAPLVVAQQLVRIDVPLMIALSIVLLALSLDRTIGRWDGVLLFLGVVAYTGFSIYQSRREQAAVAAEYAEEFGADPGAARRGWVWEAAFVVGGLALLILGARWLVESAVALAQAAGISELVIGLTVVAIGTSLPELATSVMASIRGQRDIAVGNVVGSNIFNILAVLGLSGLLAPNGISVPVAALTFDLPVMIAVAIACLPIFFTRHRIDRWEGAVFLGYFVAYIAYLLLASAQHDTLPQFSAVMLAFVVPLTVITIFVSVARTVRGGRTA